MSLILSGTDGLSDVDGSAATPAIRGTDANTGIFFPAADTIAFAEGGAECARFDSSGNFGLGVTSIATSGSRRVLQVSNGTNDGMLMLSNDSAEGNNPRVFGSAATQYDLGLAAGGSTGYVSFYTNGTERMRVNAGAPILCLAGGSTTATGTGIAFPATQSASSDANTLDDYEEGTFTPTLVAGSLSYVFQVGKYVKVGRLVSYIISLNATRTSSSSPFQVGGLPFTSDGSGSLYVASCVFPVIGFNRSTATSYIGQLAPGTTTISMYGVITSSTANYLSMVMSDTGSSIEVEIAGTYLAA